MRVMQIVDDVIAKSQSNLLKRQQASLRAGIEALLRGGRLTLTALGRSLRSTARIKHQIKQSIACWEIPECMPNASRCTERSARLWWAPQGGQ